MPKVSITTAARRADAERCAAFRKLADDYRRMFTALATGFEVDAIDLQEGLIRAMKCAATGAGQSAERRTNTETVMRLWDATQNGGRSRDEHTRSAYDVIVPNMKRSDQVGPGVPDLTQPDKVESWLSR